MNTASAAATERAMTRRAGLPLTAVRLAPRRAAEVGCQRHGRAFQLLDSLRRRAVRRHADPGEGQEAETRERSGQLRLRVHLVRMLPRADDLLDRGASFVQASIENGGL